MQRVVFIFLFFLFVTASSSLAPVKLKVTVRPKSLRGHPNFGYGSSLGMAIDGREGATLTLEIGRSYVFYVSDVECKHPFCVTLSDDISNAVAINGTVGCAQSTTEIVFVPKESHLKTTLYYGSPVLEHMGGRLQIVNETFCNKYSRKFNTTNYEFIERVANMTFFVLMQSPPELMGFFTGEKGPTNYFKDVHGLDVLRRRLCNYFGNAFGCTDANYPSADLHNMARAHAKLPIGVIHFTGFIESLLSAMALSGVEDADIIENRAWLWGFYYGNPHGVCNSFDCRSSICDRLTDKMFPSPAAPLSSLGYPAPSAPPPPHNLEFLQSVLSEAFVRAMAPSSPVRKHFDGTLPPHYVNIMGPGNEETFLLFIGEIAVLLGSRAGLFCSDEGFPVFREALTLRFSGIHLSVVEGRWFVSYVANSFATRGISEIEQYVISHLLEKLLQGVDFIDGHEPIPPYRHIHFAFDTSSSRWLSDSDLNLETGVAYRFSVNSSCAAPFYLSTVAVGFGRGAYTLGLSSDDYSLVCDGRNDVYFFADQPISLFVGSRAHNELSMVPVSFSLPPFVVNPLSSVAS